MPCVLKNWALVQNDDNPYLAPELRVSRLTGQAYGHPEFPDGEIVVTSTPVRAEGRRVWTRSGTEYMLEGPADENYVKFLAENKFKPLDEEHPFQVLEG